MTLLRHGVEPTLWLYDTYEGMPPPTDVDADPSGKTAAELLSVAAPDDLVRAYASLDHVKSAMALTGYPNNRLRFVVGKVEDTLQHTIPERIALLRLDTDWYESTKVELEVLWPRLERGGILILDDYGHWVGAKKAVDEFFGDIFMDTIDNTGRLIIKQ